MPREAQKNAFGLKEMNVYMLGKLGGTEDFVNLADIVDAVYDTGIKTFRIDDIPKFPAVDTKIRVYLNDAKKDKPSEKKYPWVTQLGDEEKAAEKIEAEREGREAKRKLATDGTYYKLTPLGVQWYNENKDAIQHYMDALARLDIRVGERNTSGIFESRIDALFTRLAKIESWTAFKGDPGKGLTTDAVLIKDFLTVFEVGPYTSPEVYRKSHQAILTALDAGKLGTKHQDKLEIKMATAYVKALNALYGKSYREVLSQKVQQGIEQAKTAAATDAQLDAEKKPNKIRAVDLFG